MSVTSVSSVNGNQTGIQSQWQQQMQDFKALANALHSGNLTTAQSSFATWQQDFQANGSTNTQTTQQTQPFGSNSQANTDFQALSSALQSGDLSSAQQAFASLQQDLQGAGHAHRHHHHHSANAADTNNSNNSTTQSSNSATAPSSVQSSIVQALLDTQA
jgi:hypothetical protein